MGLGAGGRLRAARWTPWRDSTRGKFGRVSRPVATLSLECPALCEMPPPAQTSSAAVPCGPMFPRIEYVLILLAVGGAKSSPRSGACAVGVRHGARPVDSDMYMCMWHASLQPGGRWDACFLGKKQYVETPSRAVS